MNKDEFHSANRNFDVPGYTRRGRKLPSLSRAASPITIHSKIAICIYMDGKVNLRKLLT